MGRSLNEFFRRFIAVFTRATKSSHTSIFIRTVRSKGLLSALLNWIELVYEPFGQSKGGFCPRSFLNCFGLNALSSKAKQN